MNSPSSLSGESVRQFGPLRVSRVVPIILVFGYVLTHVWPGTTGVLALVPGRVIPGVWTLATAGFLEIDFLELAFSVAGLLVTASVLEPLWGSRELYVFLVGVNTAACMATFLAAAVAYALFQAPSVLYTALCGFHGALGALLVAVKQSIPERDVRITQLLKFPAKYLPSLYVLLLLLVAVAAQRTLQLLPLGLLGTYFGWLYLRFFQTKPQAEGRGDPSPEFRFATFFPPPLHAFVDALADACVRCWPLFPSSRGPTLPARPVLPPAKSVEASRRRERGARVLEERLGMKRPAPPTTIVVPLAPTSDLESGAAASQQPGTS